MDTIGQGLNGGGRRRRRKHEPEFKARVVAACEQPGVSIASVALSNGLNANLVRRWLIAHEQGDGPGKAPEISSQGDVRLSDARPASSLCNLRHQRPGLRIFVSRSNAARRRSASSGRRPLRPIAPRGCVSC
ncbi:transposase [Pseudomonas aeruginosa]|uniref:transposase n=1 Tax=Pseudomonas aeruginosa TaxID=287 RepID=UPI00155ACEE9